MVRDSAEEGAVKIRLVDDSVVRLTNVDVLRLVEVLRDVEVITTVPVPRSDVEPG